MKERKHWVVVVVFAIAMAWLESAVVFYLRIISAKVDPAQTEVLPSVPGLLSTEAVREAATLLMIWTVGVLAGKTWRSRWGYAAIAFGVWDIFYYVFLRIIEGWPTHLGNWDVLFLLPLPWWGPVISPMLIAMLMIIWGTLATQAGEFEHAFRTEWKQWLVNFCGIVLALYVFMEDALRVGTEVAMTRPPDRFNWPLFAIALALMSVPVIQCGRVVYAKASRSKTAQIRETLYESCQMD